MKNELLYLILFFCFLLLGACARYGTPGGGPDDITPPVVVVESSDANYQTNFSERTITLSFNEWVELRNPLREIVISPPLDYPPEYSQKGKSITVRFSDEEVLRSDATYQINFGEAIRDFTAGNPVENLVYVFSTGDKIDSLSVAGSVQDEKTGKAVRNALVMLYESRSDSVLFNEKPFYFSRTDEAGKFSINNVRADSFQIYALVDNNVSYTYDLPGESVAFYNSLVYPPDSAAQQIILKLFDEEDPTRLIGYDHNTHGIVRSAWENLPEKVHVFPLKGQARVFHELKDDSLFIWHDSSPADSIAFVVAYGSGTDTLPYRRARRTMSEVSMRLESARSARVFFHPRDSFSVRFNQVIDSIDKDLIEVRDSAGIFESKIYAAGREVVFKGNYAFGKTYTATFPPGSVTGWFGQSHADTLKITASAYEKERFGTIMLNLEQFDSLNYIINLLQGDRILRTEMVQDSTMLFSRLEPGSYVLRVIEDRDGDGKWTSGRLIGRKPSERIAELPLEELRKGWDLKVDVDIKSLFDGT